MLHSLTVCGSRGADGAAGAALNHSYNHKMSLKQRSFSLGRCLVVSSSSSGFNHTSVFARAHYRPAVHGHVQRSFCQRDIWSQTKHFLPRQLHTSRRSPSSSVAASGDSAASGGSVRVDQAYEMLVLDGSHIYIDCRSESEFREGHPIESSNLPFPRSDKGEVEPSFFLSEVSARISDKDTPILVGCRSGVRSLAAIQVRLLYF